MWERAGATWRGHGDAACQFSGKIVKSSTTAAAAAAATAGDSRTRVCARGRCARVRARKLKVEYFVPTPRSIGVHESAL